MSAKVLLRLISLVALIVLVIQVAIQVHKVRSGRETLKKSQTSINWLLLAVTLVAFGGSFYANNDRISGWPFGLERTDNTRVSTMPTIGFDDQVTLSNGPKRVVFDVPRNTRMKLCLNGTVLAVVRNENGDQAVKFSYLIKQAGQYRVIADRGQHTKTATLTVN